MSLQIRHPRFTAKPSPPAGRPLVVRSPHETQTRSGPAVRIGPFILADLDQQAVVAEIVAGAQTFRAVRPWVTYALHVGGLNARHDGEYVRAMEAADLVYADGMSVVLLARLAGALRVQRCGTTDIGWDVLDGLTAALGRPPKVALIGGRDGLTADAGRVLEASAGIQVVLTEHGYHDDWAPVLLRLALSDCDVVLVGLGAPDEMKWVEQHRRQLPPCLVMTCGGWFGFVTQEEERAPLWARRSGLEWAFRLKQAPRRLAGRYAVGAISTGALALGLASGRTVVAESRKAG